VCTLCAVRFDGTVTAVLVAGGRIIKISGIEVVAGVTTERWRSQTFPESEGGREGGREGEAVDASLHGLVNILWDWM